MWVLHTFYLLSTALMLFWYLRYTHPILGRRPGLGRSPTRHGPPGLASSERPFGRMHPGEAT